MIPRHLFGASVLTLSIAAQPVLAITPDETWAGMQAMYAASGMTMTAAGTTTNGPTLEVTGITMSMDQPEMGGAFAASFDKITFTDRGDGTVDVNFADSMPMTLSIPEARGELPVKIAMTVSQPGMALIASGTPAETTFDFTAPTFSMTLDSITLPDGTVPQATFTGSGTGMTGKYTVATGADGKSSVTYTYAVGGLTLAGSAVDPAGSGNFTVTGTVADMKAEGAQVMLGSDAMQNMAAALRSGFMVDTSLSTGAIAFLIEGVNRGQQARIATTFAGSSFDLALDANRADYGFGLTGAALDMAVPDVPLPIKATWGETSMRIALPIAQTAEPQDYAGSLRLVDITMDESLWGMFDPGAQLARSPITFIADLGGKMAWTVDITDQAALQGAAMPILLDSLTLNEVLARAVGTEVAATGGLTFDNTDLVTFGGIPAPAGKITITATGINALIDTLVGMGLLPEDQVMGARMMMGMFARPGPGADQLTSDIEFKDKQLLINGAPLPF